MFRLNIAAAGYSPNASPGRDGTGVLRSVDEILRNNPTYLSSYGTGTMNLLTLNVNGFVCELFLNNAFLKIIQFLHIYVK